MVDGKQLLPIFVLYCVLNGIAGLTFAKEKQLHSAFIKLVFKKIGPLHGERRQLQEENKKLRMKNRSIQAELTKSKKDLEAAQT